MKRSVKQAREMKDARRQTTNFIGDKKSSGNLGSAINKTSAAVPASTNDNGFCHATSLGSPFASVDDSMTSRV